MAGRAPSRLLTAAALAATLSALWCDPAAPSTPPADGDADTDADAQLDADHDVCDADHDDMPVDADLPDGDGAPVPGSITVIVETVSFVTERFCDIDGDGDLDNTLASMGSPGGEMLAMILNAALESEIDTVSRFIQHYPDVDDLRGPTDREIFAITLGGIDVDFPPDPSNDYTGEGEFYVGADYVDPCGEPLYYFTEGHFEDGEGWAGGRDVLLPLGTFAAFTATEAFGTFEPFGAGGAGTTCGYATIHALGEGVDLGGATDLSVLEMLVAGGRPMGMPTVPGATPDLDLDGDGLEMFLVDDEGHITCCVDGDHTVFEGRDCWRDESMADGFSFVLAMTVVSARLVGLERGWEHQVEGTCDDPPTHSLWGDF